MAQASGNGVADIELLGWTADHWSAFASVSTVAGVAVALFGGYLALRSYRNANRAASNAHMHALFRDYLRIRFDFEAQLAAAPSHDRHAELRNVVASQKLYVLEEMWVWIEDQRRRHHRWALVRRIPQVARRREILAAWDATVLSHVCEDESEVVRNIYDATDCYSLDFLTFLGANMIDPVFVEMAAWQNKLHKAGDRRPHYKLAEEGLVEARRC